MKEKGAAGGYRVIVYQTFAHDMSPRPIKTVTPGSDLMPHPVFDKINNTAETPLMEGKKGHSDIQKNNIVFIFIMMRK